MDWTLIASLFALLFVTTKAFTIDQPLCEYTGSHGCKRCDSLETLKVMSLNVWGNSWFNDEPIVSVDEPYNVTEARTAVIQAGNMKPNAFFLGLLNALTDAQFVAGLNPSRKKLERLTNICHYIRKKKPDVTFLQEVWYKKDYDFIQDCLGDHFHLSEFDLECGETTPMVNIKCSGVTTVTQYKILNQRYENLSSGNNWASEVSLELWSDHLTSRKVLFNDIEVGGCRFRLVNTHLTPYDDATEQKREVRVEQTNTLITALGCHWDFVILGMDMNDVPTVNGVKIEPYSSFIRSGFQDMANPDQSVTGFGDSGYFYYFPTYATTLNTWLDWEEPAATLDYAMAMGKNNRKIKSEVWVKQFEIKELRTLDSDVSFSDHQAVWAEFETRCHERH